jgi:hypothetical protein
MLALLLPDFTQRRTGAGDGALGVAVIRRQPSVCTSPIRTPSQTKGGHGRTQPLEGLLLEALAKGT